MNYLEKLAKTAELTGTISCLGLDYNPKSIPSFVEGDSNRAKIENFNEILMDKVSLHEIPPGAFKPNLAFFDKYPGLMEIVKKKVDDKFPEIIKIGDAKRGDIANTSTMYAEHIFDVLGFDAMTVHPYMGSDSIKPFLEYTKQGKGIYLLCLTSNEGNIDFEKKKVITDEKKLVDDLVGLAAIALGSGNQVNNSMEMLKNSVNHHLKNSTKFLYEAVAEQIANYSKTYPGIGAVIGVSDAAINELTELAKYFKNYEIPLLLPGVGKQGGSAVNVMRILKEVGYPIELVRVNNARAILYPWEMEKKEAPSDWSNGCALKLIEFNKELEYKKAA